MADEFLVVIPFGLAVGFAVVAVATILLRTKVKQKNSSINTSAISLRDGTIFALGAALLAGFFLFNAAFSYSMG